MSQFSSLIIHNWKTNKSNITCFFTNDIKKHVFPRPQIAFRFNTPCIYYRCLWRLDTHSVHRQSPGECSQVIRWSLFVSVPTKRLRRVRGVWARGQGGLARSQAALVSQPDWEVGIQGGVAETDCVGTDSLISVFTEHLKCDFCIYTHPGGGGGGGRVGEGVYVLSLLRSARRLSLVVSLMNNAPVSPERPSSRPTPGRRNKKTLLLHKKTLLKKTVFEAVINKYFHRFPRCFCSGCHFSLAQSLANVCYFTLDTKCNWC